MQVEEQIKMCVPLMSFLQTIYMTQPFLAWGICLWVSLIYFKIYLYISGIFPDSTVFCTLFIICERLALILDYYHMKYMCVCTYTQVCVFMPQCTQVICFLSCQVIVLDLSRSGVGLLWPEVQIWPMACFHRSHELRIAQFFIVVKYI